LNERFVEEVGISEWHGPFGANLRASALDALEQGKVLFFPALAFSLSDTEQEFLSPAVASGKSKNISFDHTTGKLQGMSVAGEKEERLARMVERFGKNATALVEDLLGYRNFERARTSYRPVEIEGRSYSPRADDRLLHVDAFPSRPMHGRRILRFFANVAPERPRSWEVGEPFEDFARKFLPRVREEVPGKSWLFDKLGVTRGMRSSYDEVMLQLHDRCKLDADYQRNGPHTALSFPPGTCWMVYTDQVLHAALGGAFALEQTFHFDVSEMARPERAPLRVLERLSGKPLV
jgi:hypothetical protein